MVITIKKRRHHARSNLVLSTVITIKEEDIMRIDVVLLIVTTIEKRRQHAK